MGVDFMLEFQKARVADSDRYRVFYFSQSATQKAVDSGFRFVCRFCVETLFFRQF